MTSTFIDECNVQYWYGSSVRHMLVSHRNLGIFVFCLFLLVIDITQFVRCRMTNSQAATPFSYCPSTTFLHVWLHCTNTRRNKCQDLNSFPLGELEKLPGCHSTTWTKTIQQDLKSSNLYLNEAIGVHSKDWCLHLLLHTPSGACQIWRRRKDSGYCILWNILFLFNSSYFYIFSLVSYCIFSSVKFTM